MKGEGILKQMSGGENDGGKALESGRRDEGSGESRGSKG